MDGQSIHDRQGRPRRAKNRSEERIAARPFYRPQASRWDGQDAFSFFEATQCSNTASGNGKVSNLYAIHTKGPRLLQPSLHGSRIDEAKLKRPFNKKRK